MLYIVATPIWNLEDITLRALKTLESVDIVACEDTRKSGMLLHHFNIKKPLLSFHSYSDERNLWKIMNELKAGKTIAYISDAGTPGISDPWFLLVKWALENNIPVTPIPWVSAFLTCLQTSGLPIHHFLYLWFLPVKKGRQTLFTSLQNKEYPVVIYESVHRIEKTLTELEKYFWKEHHVVIWRELTKKFEEFFRGNISDAVIHFKNKEKQKGEFVVIF